MRDSNSRARRSVADSVGPLPEAPDLSRTLARTSDSVATAVRAVDADRVLAPDLPPASVRRAVSRDNHEFDPAARRWTLNKEVTIDLELVVGRLAAPLRWPYRRVLQFHAENYSPAYCNAIHQSAAKLLRAMGADGFSESVLCGYRQSLDRAHEWRLATLRAFLMRWRDQGYPGISSEAVEFLAAVKLKGNEKGGAVLGMDPDEGPFDDQELTAILDALPQHYERGAIGLDVLAFALLLAHTGRRPGQLSLLRAGDLQKSASPDGREAGILRIPRSKQRGHTPRAQFKPFPLTPDLHRVLLAQRDVVLERVQAQHGELPPSLILELPLFPDSHLLDQVSSKKALEAALRNDALHIRLADLRAGLAKVHVLSARTGRRLRITPRRFRYSLGTRAARQGYGAMVIAELLDHSDLQNVRVYTRDHPNFRRKIDRAVGKQLAPLARAFARTLVDSEAQARHGADPRMRVGTRGRKVGTCGSRGFCGAEVAACYTCIHFQPWRDERTHVV